MITNKLGYVVRDCWCVRMECVMLCWYVVVMINFKSNTGIEPMTSRFEGTYVHTSNSIP